MRLYIQLIDKDGKDMLGSDGRIKLDKRFNGESIKRQIRKRNKDFQKHFPHKKAYAYRIDSMHHEANFATQKVY